MNNEMYEEEGLSILELLKLIWKRKILVGIITGVFFIVFILFVVLVYNPSKRTYSATFELTSSTTTIDDKGYNSTTAYPSGKTFNYKSITSKNSISSVLNDSKYSKLNVDSMVNGTQISTSNGKYTITVVSAKKGNATLYKEYIETLVDNALVIFDSDIDSIDYEAQLDSFNDYYVYSSSISFIQEKVDELVENYKELTKSYTENTVVEGKTLKAYQTEVESYFKNNSLNSLNAEATANHYVVNSEKYNKNRVANVLGLQKEYDETIDELNALIDLYENNLKPNGTSGDSFTKLIDQITELKANSIKIKSLALSSYDYDVETKMYYSSVTFVENKNFNDRVIEVYNKLKEFYSKYENNVKTIYKDQTSVSYDKNSIITESGTKSIYVVAALGLIGGLVIASVVALIIEVPKYKKEKEAEKNTAKAE